MKVASILPFFALLSSALGLSNAIIAARQAQHSRRSVNTILDVCAALDVDLTYAPVIIGGLPIILGHLDVCLCVSALPVFIQANAVAQIAALVMGEDAAIALIASLINAAPGHKSCTYPAHARALCSRQNVCGFDCTDGYSPSPSNNPTSCACLAPRTVCNGRCDNFPQGCGTANAMISRNTNRRCEPGYEVCGVPGGRPSNWECVDTRRDLESCGGCATPLADAPHGRRGRDCSAIPHVSSVSCFNGMCRVEACLLGYVPSVTADACIAVAIRTKRDNIVARSSTETRNIDAIIAAAANVEVGDIIEVKAKAGVAVDI